MHKHQCGNISKPNEELFLYGESLKLLHPPVTIIIIKLKMNEIIWQSKFTVKM